MLDTDVTEKKIREEKGIDKLPTLMLISMLHPLSFPDGNTALLAQNIVFLVHRGVLARHSTILSDAINALDTSNHLNGSPVLELDDNPDDLAHFLLALYDGVYVFTFTIHPL